MSDIIKIRGLIFNKENLTYLQVKSYFQDFTEDEFNDLLGIKKKKVKLSDKSFKSKLSDKGK
jgi:hypothetical protein